MKPVKEIALILDVSQVTVYNHINKLKDEIKAHIYNVKGATYLDDEGIRQLKISMGLIQVPEVKQNISMNNIIDEISNSVSENITNNIKKDYEDLRKEVRELKDRNEKLISLIESKEKKFSFKNLFSRNKE